MKIYTQPIFPPAILFLLTVATFPAAGQRASARGSVNQPNRSQNAGSNRNASANNNANRNANANSNTNVNRNANVNNNTNVNRNANVNNNVNVNRNVNVNQNVNVNRDVNVNTRGNYYGGGCCYNSGIGTAAAVTAAAVGTAMVVGAMVNSLPPSCAAVVANGVTYQKCGSTYYQPQFAGGNTTYVVVNAP